ncbi:MAG: ankyrin repeat domain-containing protein [Planctomycetota bacterium]|nr:ankyrin repeat domain-containing protein [Planctomycetota bacterium]
MRCAWILGWCLLWLLATAPAAHADLLTAAEAGDLEAVKRALDAGTDPNAVPEDTWSALHIATLKGHEPVVKLLIARGADVNLVQFGALPLHLALDRQDAKLVRLLVEAGSELDRRNGQGLRPLHVAIEKKNRALIDLLLDGKPNLEGVDRYGRTPLALAADKGDLELVRLFLDRGAMVNARLSDGRRPLHLSIYHRHAKVTALLLERGARHDLLTAAAVGDLETIGKLVDRGDPVDLRMHWSGTTPIMWAARRGQTAAVKRLLERGASRDVVSNHGLMAMHYAAQGGETACARVLLDAGALIDPSDRDGTTPLHEAAKAGHAAMIAFLVEQGASVNARHQSESFTALYEAAFNGHTAAVRALVVAKADVTLKTASGQTPLHAGLAQVEITRTLLDAGAKADEPNRRKRTALHEAAQEAHVDSALLLIERGANVRLTDDRGSTPLHAVASRSFVDSLFDSDKPDLSDRPDEKARLPGRLKIAAALLAKEADPRAEDKQRRIPYAIARKNGYTELATLLGKAAGEIDDGR